MSVPRNNEHAEAVQAEVTGRKETLKKEMSPEAIARLDAVESASRILEEAKVPFALFAEVPVGKTIGFWQFNKLEYTPEGTPFEERAKEAGTRIILSLTPSMHLFTLSQVKGVDKIIYIDAEGKPLFGYQVMSDGGSPEFMGWFK